MKKDEIDSNDENENVYYFLNDDKTFRICTKCEYINQQTKFMREKRVPFIGICSLNGCTISTYWDGIDDSRGQSFPPLLFETIVSGNKEGVVPYLLRYSTLDEANEGHKKIVRLVEAGVFDEE